MMHDLATAVFALCLPVAVLWGMSVGLVGLMWQREMRRVLDRLRDDYTEFWLSEGMPWYSNFGPMPWRSERERRADAGRVGYGAAFGWMLRFSLRQVPAPLASDAELVRMHRRAAKFVMAITLGGLPLVPFVAVAVYVLYFG